MKRKSFLIFGGATALLVAAGHFSSEKSQKKQTLSELQAAPTQSLRDMVDQTCGACHAQTHLRPPGNYSLNDGASARTPGAFALSLGTVPYAMVNGDPKTSIIVRKPLEGSGTPHGGIKIPATHETMVKLMDWVNRTPPAPQNELDRAAPAALSYNGANAGANEHMILYTRRQVKPQIFQNFDRTAAGGHIYKMKFQYDPGTHTNAIISDVDLTGGTPCTDAMNPSVSLDGTKVTFACRESSTWQIWKMNIDGSNAERITTGTGNKIQPTFLPYLPDGTPARSGEGGVVMAHRGFGHQDEYDTGFSFALAVCDDDGNNLRQIDFNPSHSFQPWLHSSGMLIFSRWEHNEHQGENFMSLFQMAASDYLSAGTSLFGAFGEHTPPVSDSENAFFEPSEVLDTDFGKTDNLFSPTYGKMIARYSMRDSIGGSIVGPFTPRLQQTAGGGELALNLIQFGDDAEDMVEDLQYITSTTYRTPRSLLSGLYAVSVSTLISISTEATFGGGTEFNLVYGTTSLHTFELVGGVMTNRAVLLDLPGVSLDEVTPVVIKPQPPKIGKPVDLTMKTGTFTSGNVTDRNPSDGQPRGFTAANVSVVRFIRSLQMSQGKVDTGRDTDEGIATSIVGEAPIYSDGSFSAEVPANVPLQFQVLDTNGRVLVNHKPWIHVMPGATERCVGCHSRHDKPIGVTDVQTLIARQSASTNITTAKVVQFNFERDIQPILNARCVSCHDNAKTVGAAGRRRQLSLVGRETPARTTESFQSLVGYDLVRTQNAKRSELIWWLTGTCLDSGNCADWDPAASSPITTTFGAAYPQVAASVPHSNIVTAEELVKISKWIDTGVNFRVVENDTVGASLSPLNMSTFDSQIWPILEQQCFVCHISTGVGGMAMDLDGDPEDAEDEEDVIEKRLEQISLRLNFMVPEASLLLRKPLSPAISGLTHVGSSQVQWTKDSDEYKAIYAWIASVNPTIAAAPPPTDLVNVNNFPNPFRDNTTFVYGLTGSAASRVQLKIYSQSGKVIRELEGTTTQNSMIGWNKVEWDGKDSNGKKVGNDVYFYTVEADFGDGIKKRFRGKCAKVK